MRSSSRARHPAGQGGGVRLAPGVGLKVGQTVAGKYRVDGLLGAGASGLVIAARHIWLRHPVTLKILVSYTEGQTDNLNKQVVKARAALRLRGAHICRVLDIGTTDDGLPFVATEHLEGHTLEAELDARERIPWPEAVAWIVDACEGLAEAHSFGLFHGDLKPQNIFLSVPARKRPRRQRVDGEVPEAEERVLKILDFGSASPVDTGDASASAWFASPAYLSPEQIKDDQLDARSDIWALAVILYEMIAGSLPFSAETVSGMLVSVVMDSPALLTDAPYELARLVHRCLDKDPRKRPSSVAELAEALAPFAGPTGRVRAAVVGDALASPPPADERDPDRSGSVPAFEVPAREPGRSHPTQPSLRALSQRNAVELKRRLTLRRRVIQGTIAAGVLVVLGAVVDALDSEAAESEPAVQLTNDEPTAIERAFEPPPAVPLSDERPVRETATPESLRPAFVAPPPPPAQSSRIIRHFPTTPAPPPRSSAMAINLPWGLPSVRSPLPEPPSRRDRPRPPPTNGPRTKEAALPPRDDAPRHVTSNRK